MSVRVVAVADLHGQLPPIPPCDVLLVAGDICPMDDHSSAYQRAFLEGPFADWLEHVPASAIAGVAGNHDLLAARDPALLARLPWTYLSDSAATLGGLRIWGTPWAVTYGDWAFMEPDADLAVRFSAIPAGLDVLLAHGPPLGICDRAVRDADAGSAALRDAIERVQPTGLRLRSHPRGSRRGDVRGRALPERLRGRRAVRPAARAGGGRARDATGRLTS